MLLGAAAGSLAVTNASANSNVDILVNKININNLFNVNTVYTGGIGVTENNNGISIYNRFQTYKIKRSLKVTNEYKHKTATLPKGSVVTGYNDGQGNLVNIDNTTLSIKNQSRVRKLGNWHYSYPSVKENNGAANKYVRNTAFSYNSLASVPMLSVKTSKAQVDGATSELPFISVTADKKLVYHKTGQTFRATSYAKISKVKRTHSMITYYLNRRTSGVTTKKVKVGKHYRYRVSLKLAGSFQSGYNGDRGAYNLNVKNGKQVFFLPIDINSPVESQLDLITGYETVSAHDKKISAAYVQGLY